LSMTGAFRETGTSFFFIPKGALTHHIVVASSISLAPPQAAGLAHCAAPPLPTKQALRGPLFGGGIPPAGRAVRSARRIALSAESARQCRRACGLRSSLPVRPADGFRLICIFAANHCPCLGTTCHPPAKTCHRQLSRSYGRCIPGTVHFLLSRQKKQNRPLQGAEGK